MNNVIILVLNTINKSQSSQIKALYDIYLIDTNNNLLKFYLNDACIIDTILLKQLTDNFIVEASINNFSYHNGNDEFN